MNQTFNLTGPHHESSAIRSPPLLAAVALLAATGCAVTRDQSSVGAYIDDTAITTAVKGRMVDNKTVDASAISVETLNGTVMLSGFAKSSRRAQRRREPGAEDRGREGREERDRRPPVSGAARTRAARHGGHRGRPAPRLAILSAMTGATPAIRLLHLEDSESDHVLAMAYLQRSGIAVDARRIENLEDSEPDHVLAMAYLQRSGTVVDARRIESRAEFEAALDEPWDIVLSDYHLPGFGGLEALQMLRASGRPLPFILVSGQIGEDTAVEAMRNGASDYLLKANLARLAPAVEHAIAASEAQRARLAADRELQASRKRLSELAQHLQTSVEAERQAIAREIHDDVGGSLTALKFELDWIRRHATAPAVQQRVTMALETVTHAIEASQRIMQNLRPAILEQGLVAALQWMTSRFEKRTGIACEFRTSGLSHERRALPAGVPLVAYRTAQEALTNVSKHAGATRVEVDLSITGGVLSLEVSDNGRGLRPDDLAKAQSFGLRGLHERASTVGGWVDLSSGAAGTSLILSVPLHGRRRRARQRRQCRTRRPRDRRLDRHLRPRR